MKLNNQQAIFLFEILRDSLQYSDDHDDKFVACHEIRQQYFQNIFMQQNDEIRELED